MKKSKVETAKTRQRIVEVASEAIRTQGIDATGVSEIMARAGLTHGGFYRHFGSKDELVTEAIELCRKDFVAGTVAAAAQGAEAVLKHFQNYVTPGHRDDIGGGCVLAANGSEIVRADDKTRHVVTESIRLLFEKAAPFMRSATEEKQIETAMSVLTNMVGALTLSRIVDDPVLSKKILDVASGHIANAIDVTASAPRKDTKLSAA